MTVLSPQALGVLLGIGLVVYGGVEAVRGVKWVGHKVVHALKHVPKPPVFKAK